MMCSLALPLVVAFLLHISASLALGINCRGSGLCPRATWNNNAPVSVIQLLRDAVYASSKSLSTTYKNGDHVICVSQNQPITLTGGFKIDGFGGSIGLSGHIGEGGICLFPQSMSAQAGLSLAQIRPLMDALLQHKCSTCGSVPIHYVDQGNNSPSQGILTFNYVAAPYCIGECISAVGGGGPAAASGGDTQGPAAATSSSEGVQTVTVTALPETTSSNKPIVVTVTASTTTQHASSPSSSGCGESKVSKSVALCIAFIISGIMMLMRRPF